MQAESGNVNMTAITGRPEEKSHTCYRALTTITQLFYMYKICYNDHANQKF